MAGGTALAPSNDFDFISFWVAYSFGFAVFESVGPLFQSAVPRRIFTLQ